MQLIRQLGVSYFVKGESFMFKKYSLLILFISLFLVSSEMYAQQSGDCNDGPPGPGGGVPCPPSGPIGGGAGIVLLLSAGVAYGIKKFRE